MKNTKLISMTTLIFLVTLIAFDSCLFLKKANFKKTTEEGFTGNLKSLFNYNEFFSKSNSNMKKTISNDPAVKTYGYWVIHDAMLKDSVRTLAYRDAMFKNREVFKDKIVLDIGAGSGVLSIFAAQAGAKHVYGFEFSDFAEIAMKNVNDNGLSDKVTIIKQKTEEGVLPVDKVDIIVSEWMDSLLFGENMISSVLYARDKWLKNGGIMIPDKADIKLAAVDSKRLREFLGFFDDVYGIKMPALKNMINSNNIFMEIEPEELISTVDTIYSVDLYKMKKEDIDFAVSYSLKFIKTAQVTALTSWFSVEFNLPNKVFLSTSPLKEMTHWKQDNLFLDLPFKVAEGETLNGSISIVTTNKYFKRANEIKVSYHYEGRFGKYDNLQQLISYTFDQ